MSFQALSCWPACFSKSRFMASSQRPARGLLMLSEMGACGQKPSEEVKGQSVKRLRVREENLRSEDIHQETIAGFMAHSGKSRGAFWPEWIQMGLLDGLLRPELDWTRQALWFCLAGHIRGLMTTWLWSSRRLQKLLNVVSGSTANSLWVFYETDPGSCRVWQVVYMSDRSKPQALFMPAQRGALQLSVED